VTEEELNAFNQHGIASGTAGLARHRHMTVEQADDILERQIARGGGLPVTELEVEAAYVHDRSVQGELFTVNGERKVVTPVPAAWAEQRRQFAIAEQAYQATIEKLTKQNEELRRIAHGAVKAIDTLHNDVRAVLPGGHRLSKRLTHWNERLKKLEG